NGNFDSYNLPNQNDSSIKIPSFYHLSSYVDITKNLKKRSMIPMYTFDRPILSHKILQPPFLFYESSNESSFFGSTHEQKLLDKHKEIVFHDDVDANHGAAIFHMMKLIAALW